MTLVHDHFDSTVGLVWDIAAVGAGRAERTPHTLRLTVDPTPAGQYSNAQITDYGFKHTSSRPAYDFRWGPPLRLTIRAAIRVDSRAAIRVDSRAAISTAAAAAPVGTAGFGFWNHPFSPDARRLPRLPAAIWFFYGAPPNDMRLADGVPGHGWKAAVIETRRAGVWAVAPLTPLLIPLMRSRRGYAALYPRLQRLMGIAETALDPERLGTPHTYTIDWRTDGAVFAIDGVPVLTTPFAPQGRLGFCAWIDNQYAIVTPQGRFGFGVTPVMQAQTLEIDEVQISGG